MDRTAPSDSQIEVNLFGGGNAYGETILVHLGFNKWISVDSIKNPITNSSLVLEYFNDIGKDPKNIELIVASHWHDDHIKGISELYNSSESKISISQALSKDYIAKLISLDEFKESSNSGLREFSNVVKKSIELKTPLIRAIQDRPLLDLELNGSNAKVIALSPSDKSIEEFEKELSSLINDAHDLNLASKKLSPNHSSVVLLIQIEQTKILLGADLEVTSDQLMGWEQILKASSTPKDNSVEIFKIPHHGSENGHYDKIWNEVLAINNHISILTPYGRGRKKLPSEEDRSRILKFSPESYITSRHDNSTKPKKRNPRANKIIRELAYKIRERKYTYGHIQLRREIKSQPESPWEINLFGNALKLSNY
jgi:hypothetical protein